MSEFHDLAETSLNRDGQSWGNLGYWKYDQEYSNACRSLATLLGDAIELDANSDIFDLGFGCGDQLLLWRQHYKAARIAGLNRSHSQTALARQSLSKAGFEKDSARLKYGDAAAPKDWGFAGKHSKINRVIALDCAYHFSDRRRFFELAGQHLSCRGRIGLTDFILPPDRTPSWVDRAILNVMLKLSHIPKNQMVSEPEYAQEIQDAGFDRIKIEDISADVMPGFAQWWNDFQNGQPAQSLSGINRIKYHVTARFLHWAYRKNILRYCLITATKT